MALQKLTAAPVSCKMEMAAGWLELDGEYYYFEPDTGEMCTGWHETEAGRRYLMELIARYNDFIEGVTLLLTEGGGK